MALRFTAVASAAATIAATTSELAVSLSPKAAATVPTHAHPSVPAASRPDVPEVVQGRTSPCGPVRLRSGGCVYVFAAADVEDASQMALLPHFVLHYASMGIPLLQILLLVHVRPPNGHAEAEHVASWLRKSYGISRVRLLIETGRDSAYRFLIAVWSMLRDILRHDDWLIHVELDELVVFPPADSYRDAAWTDFEQPVDVHAFFEARDAEKICTIEGFVVDRMAADGALASINATSPGATLFEQFPLNCATGMMLRRADPRRTVAYRGFLRVDPGHHVAFALNREMNKTSFGGGWIDYTSWFSVVGMNFRAKARRMLGQVLFRLSPLSDWEFAPFVFLWPHFATVFHFKWTAGLRHRMEFFKRNGWLQSGQHEEWLSENGTMMIGDIKQMCREPPIDRMQSPLHPQEMQLLIQWDKGEDKEVARRFVGKPQAGPDYEQRMVLYQIFHHSFSYDVHDALNFVLQARLKEE